MAGRDPPPEVNPFASPMSTDQAATAPVEAEQMNWLYRKGNLLVMHKNAVLPQRCVKSNQPADGYLRRKLAWVHPAVYLTLLLGLLPLVIVAVIMQKKATIHVGLSAEWFRKRRRTIAIAWAIVAAGMTIAVASGFLAANWRADAGLGIALGMLLVLGGASYGLIAAPLVVTKRISRDFIWLKGVHPDFLASLPIWPYQP